jgi:hypothetical protein
MTGGYDTITSNNVTGHGASMIGMGGTGGISTRFGGGIGFNYTANYSLRVGGHFWGYGFNTNVTNYRLFTGLAVFVR